MNMCVRRTTAVAVVLFAALSFAQTTRITDNATDDGWSGLRGRASSRGEVIWKAADGVRFFNGATETLIQPNGALSSVDTALGLGPGASAGSVVGFWRRGTDTFWIWQEGGSPVEVSNVNPFFAERELNPETAAGGGGCVFIVYQTQNDDSDGTSNFRHVFKASFDGNKQNLTGSSLDSYVENLSASGCRAAWHFDPDLDAAGDDQILYYNGSSVVTIDSGAVSMPHLAGDALVWVRVESGAQEIYYSNVSAVPTAPQQLTPLGDPARQITTLRTDGAQVAWIQETATGTSLQFDGTMPLPLVPQFAFLLELDGGLPLWSDPAGVRAIVDGQVRTIPLGSATDRSGGNLVSDSGWLAHAGHDVDAGVDLEVYRTKLPSGTDGNPDRPIVVRGLRSAGSASVISSHVLGVAGYNVHRARGFGAARDTVASLPGGTTSVLAVNGQTVSTLSPAVDYSFAMTSRAGSGAQSAPTRPLWSWEFGASFPAGFQAWAIAVDPANRLIVYASAHDATYKSTDGGWTWTQLTGGIQSKRVRALAVGGGRVFAATQDGQIWRTIDGGTLWVEVATGEDLGEQVKSLAIDPRRPDVIYAGDFQLATYDGFTDSYVIRSADGGDTWDHLPAATSGEIHAYDLAFDRDDSQIVFAGGSGVPVLRSEDSGQNWTDVSPTTFLTAEALATDSLTGDLWAGGHTFDVGVGDQVGKIYRSPDGGTTWFNPVAGLPSPLSPVFDVLARGGVVFLATAGGVWFSEDSGALWHPYRFGTELLPGWVEVKRLALAGSGRILATGSDGLRVRPLHRPLPPDGSDFGGDGFSDLVWRNLTTGENVLWSMETVARRSYGKTLAIPGTDWQMVATGDFNRDGRADLVWRNGSLGRTIIWFMNGTTRLGYADVIPSVPAPWVIGGAGDFDRDGDADLLWRHPGSGQNILWRMEGSARVSYTVLLTVADTQWRMAGAGDFDADGDADVVWRNDGAGRTVIWLMENGVRVSYGELMVVPDPSWNVVAIADFNGDGWSDVVWRNESAGTNVLWFMEGLVRASYGTTFSVPGAEWQLVGPR